MDSLLITFNGKQFSPDIKTISYQQDNQKELIFSCQAKKQMNLRAFRSRKPRRYEQFAQNVSLDQYSCYYLQNRKNHELNSIHSEHLIQNAVLNPSKHIQLGLKPKVSGKSKKFPSDFNSRSSSQPKSMQIIRQQEAVDLEDSFKRQIRDQIQMVIRKRNLTSKDEPKISFPASDKKLPKVFRFRSISHQNVNPSSGRKASNNAFPTDIRKQKEQSQKKKTQKRRNYLNLNKLTENLRNSQPKKGKTVRRRKIESFYLNAQETPHFKKGFE